MNMENQFSEEKLFDSNLVKKLISFVVSKWLLIFSAALSISLIYLLLNIVGSNFLKPTKYMKASIFIQQNIINFEHQIDAESINDNKNDFILNYMNFLDRDLVSRALDSYVNSFEIDQVFPYLDILPGEQNLNRVYDVLLGDEIYKYIKRLSLDPVNLSKISMDVVEMSKNYFTISMNLSASKISEDDAKLIINSIVSEINNHLNENYNISNVKLSKLTADFSSNDISEQTKNRRMFETYQKIKQIHNSLAIFDEHYAATFNNLSTSEVNLKLDLIKIDFANLVVSEPDFYQLIMGYDSLKIKKLEEEIEVIISILNDINKKVENITGDVNQESLGNVVLSNNNFEKLLSMESDNQMTKYKSTLYERKINLTNKLSDIKNFIFYPSNTRNKVHFNDELQNLENDIISLVNIHNNYVETVRDNLGQTNTLSFLGNMYVNDNDKLIDAESIKNSVIILVISLILNILLSVIYFSIYRTNIN